MSEELQYLNLIKDILEKGTWEEGRNGKTKSVFGNMMRFSLKDGKIPILTTKKTAWKTTPAFGSSLSLPGQQPAAHLPPSSNSIVLPLSGTCTGTVTALVKASVLVPGRTLPPLVATSFACEAITAAGLTNSLIT